MASASMKALQKESADLNERINEVNASIKALGDVPDDNPTLQAYRKQLRGLESDLKDVNTTMKDYTRGVKAAGELYRHYAMGNIEDMSIKAIRAGVNGMKKRLDNLKAGGDPGDAEEMRLIEAITTEADVVVKRFKTDYQNVVEEIARGGTVTEQTLKRTRDGLADLMQTAETEAEKNELTNYWQKVGAAIEAVAVENRRLRGEVADREEAMRIAYATDHDGSQQAIHDAEARADAARRENDELRQRLDLKQQQRRELEQKMENNSIQQQTLTDRRDELKAQEKEDRAIRKQRVDDANKELNAARRAAKTQQQAYDEQKQTVEKLRTEVQGLTDDIRKMGEVKAEPKIDTSKLERQLEVAKRDLAEIAEDERKANEALKQFGITTADITDDAKLQAAAEKALKEEEESRLELAKQMLQVRKQIGQEELKDSRIVGSKDTQAFYAKNKGVLDDEYWKSEAGGGSISRMYKYLNDISDDPEAKAEFKEQVGMTVKDAMRVAGQRMREVVQEAMKRGIKIDDALSDFADGYGHGPATKIEEFMREFNETVGDKEDELIKKRREKLDAIADVVYDPGEEMASRDERLRLAKESLKGVGEGYYGNGKPLSESYKEQQAEVTRLESEMKKLSETSQQSAQSSEQLAQKQEQLSQKTAELNQQQDKLNGMVDETVTANQRLAKAEQEQTDARNAQAEAKEHEGEAVKKVEDELRGLTDEQLKNAQAYSHLTEEINTDTAAMQRNITTEQEATREADRLRSGSIDKMEQALARLRESNRKLDPTIDKEEWERGERAIGQLNLRLEELKKQSAELRREPVLDMMTQRMQSLGTLSSDTLTETKKFWETMVAGAQKGSTELADYEQHLKSIALEEQARVREQGREAFAFFQREDYRRTNAADTEEQRKALVAYRDALPADAIDHIEAINALLEKHAQFVKEAAGEWMSLEKAMELASKAGTDQFAGSAKDIQLATQSLERQRDTIIATIREKRNLGQATKAEEDQLADLTKKLRSLKFEQDNVNMSQEKMRTLIETPANAVNLDELRAAIKRADGQLRQMEQSLGQNSSEYKRFAEQVRNAKNVMKEMEGQAKASATAWEKAFNRLKTYVVMYMGFNEVWQKVSNTARDLMDLSDRMGEVRKTTGFTADEVGRLSDNLTKLDTRTNLTGLMEFSSLAGSVGLKTQEAVQGFTEAANMLSVSLPELGKEASRTLMKIADATGDLEKNGNNVRETLERVGSTVIALRANSAAAAGPITDFVSRVGAVGAQAGISIDQIAALGATVDALGGRVEMSATALSRMIPAIRNNTFEVAQAIGMTEKQLKQMSGIDQMVAVFKALHDSVKNFDMTTEEGMNAAADAVEGMLGRSVSMQDVMKQLNQQGARAGIVFGLLSQNVDTLEKQLKIATDAYRDNTALMAEYNKMNDTTAAKWERLKNQLEEAFVSDSIQRGLGSLIDMLRGLVDFITGNVTGVLQSLRTAFLMLAAAATVYRIELGKMIFVESLSGLSNLKKALVGVKDTILLTAMYTKDYIALKWKLIFAHGAEEKAAIKAKIATLGLNKALTANVWMAVVAAIGMLLLKLYQFNKAAKEAAAETGRFNQQIADEQKALNKLFEPLNRSNMAQEERLKLINEINSKYGKYLGYMLSETSSAIALADAHALIAKRIREEAYEKRIAEKEAKIQDEHSEDVNAAYTKITERVRGSVRGGASAQEIADVLKGIVDNRLGSIKYAYDDSDNIFKARTNYYLDPKIKQAIDGGIERLIVDGKLSRDNVTLIQKAVYKYTVEAHSQHKDIMNQTSNLRSDLRGVQSAIKVDLANNLNTLVSRVASSVGNAVRNIRQQQQPQQNVPLMLQQPQGQGSRLPSLFGGGQQGGWQAPWQQGRETTPQQQAAPKGWKPNIDKKDTEAVRQFVQDQEALRSALNASGNQIDEAQRRVAESWLLTDAELKEYKKIVEKADRGPGGSNHNPYGDYNKVTSPYKEWNGNDLVARRKEMLERVKALANGADVQAVLSEDAKFISEAVRKNIKTTDQAIEWYNTERLKIQDALHAKHLTNTGDWMDPEKVRKRVGRVVNDEMKYYLDELDAYYTERKAKIQEAQNDQEISEAEARNRTLANDAEWQQRRAELQLLYSKRRGEVVQQEQDEIFRIISERTGETTAYIKADIAQTNHLIEETGKKNKAAMDRIYGDIELGAERSFLRQRNAIGQHMKDITAIVNKENPYAGIAEELRKNLGTMDALLTDIEKEEERTMEKEIERTMFILEQSTKGYSLTWEQLMGEMAKRGWQAWADAIDGDSQTQQRLMHQVYRVFEKVQDAIKKEASELKKQADIMWSNILLPGGDGKTTIKDAFEQAIGALGIQEGRVSRANSLIGAGVASERVADKLAIQQLKVQLAMQQYQYSLVHKIGKEKIDMLRREAEMESDAEKARQLRMQAQNAEMALNLATRKEQTDELKLQEDIIAKTEESEARLYKELREWADLLTSSLQGVMEASHAGDAEYYNELAKLNLTGKGGPGAGTYIVIDDAGTSDATAHYEYLDERQALEREHEIEQQNAQAEAWKKVMDDINMKLSETITDQINAMLQNQSIDANTQAVLANTQAIYASMGQSAGTGEGITRNAEGFAVDESGQVISPIQPTEPTSQPEAETPAWKPFWQMTDEEKAKNQENMTEMFGMYRDLSVQTETEKAELLAEVPGYTPPAISMTDEQIESVGEKLEALNQKEIDASKKKTQAILADQQAIKQGELQTDKTMTQSSKNMYAAMMSAANLYGVAYQAMTNDNLSAEQKFQMIALQAAGQSAIAMMQTNMFKSETGALVALPQILAECLEINPIAGAAIFAVLSALLGVAIGAATSKLAKGKSEVAQVTGASASAGRLSTGMLTYAEGNVNEFTDPASLTPGRQYNVDGADGKTYRARYMGKGAKTHITNGPEFHLVGEAGREAIIDAKTTRLLQMNETGIWRDIQTLYNGGSIAGLSTRRRRGTGVAAFADGNVGEFEEMADGGGLTADGTGGMNADVMTSMLETNSRLADLLENALANGIKAVNKWTGSDGIPAMYNKMQKEAQRHGEKYL